MATYPLKNIAIGNDTYQIAGGGGGDIFWMLEWTYGIGPTEFNHTLIPINGISAYGFDKDNQIVSTSMSDLITACLNSSPCCSCGFRIVTAPSAIDGETWFSLKSVYQVQNSSNYYLCTFEQAISATEVNQILLTVDANASPASLISCYGEKVSLGGGGSNTIFEVTLCDQYLNPVPIGQFESTSTLNNVRLVNNSSATSFDAIFAAWKTTDVIVNVGAQYDANKRHFRVVAVNEGSGVSIVAVYVQNGTPKYVNFEYSGTAWTVTKN